MERRVKAICPVPRYVSSATLWQIQQALRAINLALEVAQGVFWHEAMEREYEGAVEDGFDWILSIDSDSMFTPAQAHFLLSVFGQHPSANALAALQTARNKKCALAWTSKAGEPLFSWDGPDEPFKADIAHFGLTVISCEALASVPKPWFQAHTDELMAWGEGHVHADIHFWNQWKRAGHSLYVDPRVKIGHLEDMVSCFDEQRQYRVMSILEWRQHATEFATRYGYESAEQEAGTG